MIVRSGDKVVVHGLTGNQGSFWAERMRDYGTNVVAGVSPKKAGTEHAGLPVTATAVDAAALTGIDVSVLFVPAQAVKSSVDDAVNAGSSSSPNSSLCTTRCATWPEPMRLAPRSSVRTRRGW
jgi:succinyl-CoA synthetase alpha subunit